MSINSNIYIIDADCLNALLNSYIGKEILNLIKLRLPLSIHYELNQKERRNLEVYDFEIVELDSRDRDFAGDLIWKMNGSKEYKISYLKNRKVSHIGECEGTALARKCKGTFVCKERKAKSIIKNTLKYSSIPVLDICQFGKIILENNNLNELVEDFLDELYKKQLIG